MNSMKKIEKMLMIGAIIIATGCMHAAISHYYYQKFEQEILEQQFLKRLILNELIEELRDHDDEPELIEVIDNQNEIIVIETQEALQDVLTNNQQPSVIFFSMNGCGWCNKMKPTYDAIVANPSFADVQFYSVNGPELMVQNILPDAINVQVSGYPLFVFMDKGKYIDKQVGGSSQEVFEHKIKSMFPEIFGVIAPLAQPEQPKIVPISFTSKLITMIENQDELKDVLTNRQEPSVVFFYMNGCGWCSRMQPVFDAVAANKDCANIKFYAANGPQLNVQSMVKEITDQDMTGFPLFIFMNHGKYVDKQVGGANPENFENKVKATFFNIES